MTLRVVRALLPDLLLLALSTLVFLSAFFPVNAPDFWWHLANGKVALEEKTLHFSDPWSFTAEGKSYPPTQWAFEVAAYLIHHAAGEAGVIAVKAVLLALLFFLLGRFFLREGAGTAGALLLLLVALHLVRFRFILRPDILTFLGLAVVVVVLGDFRRGRKNRLFLLPPLFLLWVQFHSGAIFGLLLLGATWAGEEVVARVWPGRESLDRKRRVLLLRWTLAGAAVTLINPNHVRYATFAVGHVEDYAKFAIQELRPLTWGEDRLLVLYAAAVGGALLLWGRRDLPAFPAIAALGFATLRTVRLFPLFLIVSLSFFAAIPGLRRRSLRRALGGFFALAAVFLAAGAVRNLDPSRTNGLYRIGSGINDRIFPVAGADVLDRIDPEGNLFNSNIYGGYLIWRFQGERKVFTDGRSQIHEETLSWIAAHSWEEILARWSIGHCLIDHRWMKPRLPGEEMALVWWDDLSLFMITREEAVGRGIPFYEFRYPVEDRRRFLSLPLERVERELARAMEQAPRAVLPRYLLASRLGAAGEWERVEGLLADGLAITPWRGDLRVDHGIALARCGRGGEAVRELRRGLQVDDGNARGWGYLGNLLYEEGDRREAEKAFRRADRLAPGDPSYLLALGRLLEREGESARAAALYQSMARRFPDNPELRRRLARPGG